MNTHTTATRYAVSVLPDGHPAARYFTATVEYRGRGPWVVCHFGMCLAIDGEWFHELVPADREDEWLAEHRFDLDTARRLAEHGAPGLVCNGRTAAEAAG